MIRTIGTSPLVASYNGILSAGASQLLSLKEAQWRLREDSEIWERGRDDFLIGAAAGVSPEERLRLLAGTLMSEEEATRGLASFSAMESGTESFSRLHPTRLPSVARLLMREALQAGYPNPDPLHCIAAGDSSDDFVEGAMVFLCLLPTNYSRPHLSLGLVDSERDAHRRAYRLPPERTPHSPFRSPPGTIDEHRLRTFRWLALDPPLNKRWINLPPHKILNVDNEERALEILIADRGQEEYVLIWRPSAADWNGMIDRAFWSGKTELNPHEFYVRFDHAYRVHETLRPLEIAFEAALRTLQVCIGGRQRQDPTGELARSLREDVYDLLHRHSSGGDFLEQWGADLRLIESATTLVRNWLPGIQTLSRGF